MPPHGPTATPTTAPGVMNAASTAIERNGTLPIELRAGDARAACPRWAASWGTFLPKHCRGNPGHYSVHSERVTRGLSRFIDNARQHAGPVPAGHRAQS